MQQALVRQALGWPSGVGPPQPAATAFVDPAGRPNPLDLGASGLGASGLGASGLPCMALYTAPGVSIVSRPAFGYCPRLAPSARPTLFVRCSMWNRAAISKGAVVR